MGISGISDGMCLSFVVSRADLNESLREYGVDKRGLERFLARYPADGTGEVTA